MCQAQGWALGDGEGRHYSHLGGAFPVLAGGWWDPSSSTRCQCGQVPPWNGSGEGPSQAGFRPHSPPLQLRAHTPFPAAPETPIKGGNVNSECEKGL